MRGWEHGIEGFDTICLGRRERALIGNQPRFYQRRESMTNSRAQAGPKKKKTGFGVIARAYQVDGKLRFLHVNEECGLRGTAVPASKFHRGRHTLQAGDWRILTFNTGHHKPLQICFFETRALEPEDIYVGAKIAGGQIEDRFDALGVCQEGLRVRYCATVFSSGVREEGPSSAPVELVLPFEALEKPSSADGLWNVYRKRVEIPQLNSPAVEEMKEHERTYQGPGYMLSPFGYDIHWVNQPIYRMDPEIRKELDARG